MKRWRRVAFGLFIVIVGVGSFFAYRAFAARRDRMETLTWVDQTYNPHDGGDNSGRGHGWEIHYHQIKGQLEEITEQFNATISQDGGCKITIHDETMAVGVFNETPSTSTYSFSLCDIDPNSIVLKTYDLHKDAFSCADRDEVELFKLNCDSAEIEFATRDGAASISDDRIQTFTNLTGNDHEQRTSSKTNKCWLIVDDVPYAQRLAKALKHAIELCGGKPSKF